MSTFKKVINIYQYILLNSFSKKSTSVSSSILLENVRLEIRNRRACVLIETCKNVERTCMPHDVVHKVLLACEAFLADVAPMRRLTRVLAHVVHHVLLAGEGFGAKLASEV